MSFALLALIMVLGLLGPLLATPPRWRIPVVLGELLAGLLIGRTGFSLVDSADQTFSFMASIGFALIMFIAGTHVPVRDASIRAALG
ncbi:cation:proton antiporter, partial [Escherichia coli]|nr:cation:proton antiporter [Escherichia coli]